MSRKLMVQAVVVGLIAGSLSGLFGVGGGILMVPALVLVMQLDQRLAHGVSLTAVVPIAVSSTLSYAMAGEVDWPVAASLAAGAIGGALLGTQLLARIPQRVLGFAFAVFMLVTAARLVFDTGEAPGRGALSALAVVSLIAVGLLSGLLAGLLGVGGGIVMVPAMIVAFDMTATLAKGTSLAVIIPTALMGTWRNLRNGNTDLRIAGLAGLAGVASAFVGGRISIGMSETLSNALFGALLVGTAAQMLWKLAKERDLGARR